MARGAQQSGQIGQAALGARQAKAAFAQQPVQPAGQPRGFLLDVGQQVGAGRYRHLGRRGRGWRAPVGSEIDQRGIGLVANGGDQRNGAGGGGPHHDFLVEGHQIFQAAAAPGNDQHVRPRDRAARRDQPPGRNRVEPGDGGGDLVCGAFALNRHRPEQDVARKAPGDGGYDVVDHRALFRRDHADHPRQHRQSALVLGVEQALGTQALLQQLDLCQQRAGAGVFHPLDDQLIGGPLAVGRHLAGGDHLDAVFRLHAQTRDGEFPDHAGDFAAFVLEREIDVAGGVALHFRQFAAHPHAAEILLQRALYCAGDLADGVFG